MLTIPKYLLDNCNTVIVLFIIAFFSTQRYLFADLYQLTCIIPLIAGLLSQNKNVPLGNTYLMISLFTFVDIGGGGDNIRSHNFVETYSIIRYLIYFSILSLILIRYKLSLIHI